MSDNDKSDQHQVVISEQGRYSIWPGYRDIPAGWRAEGATGSKQECLDYIEQNWTDMRPLSLREKMDGTAA